MTKPSAQHTRSAREAWEAMTNLVLDNQRRREVSERTGISFGRMRALRRIAAQPMSMGQLALLLNMDRPNMTTLVDELEHLGLVQRTTNPSDLRMKLVTATPKGAALARQAQRILDRPVTALSALQSDELESLVRILRRLSGPTP
jgi:DNA-binding MarR family transcriptional regulator